MFPILGKTCLIKASGISLESKAFDLIATSAMTRSF